MDERELRVRLSHWLQGERACQTPGWLEAVQSVPRHKLVPEGYFDGWDGSRIHARDCTPEEWMEMVYHDITIVTREDGEGRPTSSSTMPSIVCKMLDFLRVEDENTILEIGTGAGYSGALLSHRLGAENVTSIDNQADLVETARERLREIGYRPHLAAADGARGCPERAPYDRIIGTCYAWPVPLPWIQQTRPGGRVVAVMPNGCVGLDVREDGSAQGRLHPDPFGFMYMRGYMPSRSAVGDTHTLTGDGGETRSWKYPPGLLAAGGWAQLSFSLLAAALVTPYEHAHLSTNKTVPPGATELLDLGDLSWTRFAHHRQEVTQGGPRRLWDEIEKLFEEWCWLGCPNRERFGLTVEPDGRHVLWLDGPESGRRWEVPTALATRR